MPTVVFGSSLRPMVQEKRWSQDDRCLWEIDRVSCDQHLGFEVVRMSALQTGALSILTLFQ